MDIKVSVCFGEAVSVKRFSNSDTSSEAAALGLC